jgi:DNA-binding FadR family transcriptional regulator
MPGRSHTARLMHELGRRIVSGQYPEHTILPGDAEFMGEFGVSRTVLREAIKTLSGKGLVQAKARVGTRVRARSDWHLFDPDVLNWHAQSGFDAAFLVSLGEMRLALEPEAAALAAARQRPAQLPQLYRWVEQMAASGTSRAGFVHADLNFHLAVAEIAANPFLRAISALIEVALVAALTRSSPVDEPGGVASSAAAHRAIADAIASGDAAAARAAMREVILEGVRRASNP